MGDEGFLAGQLHQHFAGRGAREQRGDDLEIQHLDAGAEAAADERLDHADARGIHLQALRQHEMQVVADLRHRLHGQPPGHRIEFGKARMRLDLRVVDLGAAEFFLAHQIGRGKTLAARRRTHDARRVRDCRACCRAAAPRPARARPPTCNRRAVRCTSNSIRPSARSAVSASIAATAATGSPR